MSLLHYFLSPHGRITRQAFWLGLVIMMGVSLPVTAMFDPSLGADPNEAVVLKGIKQPSFANTLWNLFLCWPSAAISIKRFNDRDRPQWIGYLLGLLMVALVIANYMGFFLNPDSMSPLEKLAFLGLFMFFTWSVIDNGFFKGTDGPNRYGPDPLGSAPQSTT